MGNRYYSEVTPEKLKGGPGPKAPKGVEGNKTLRMHNQPKPGLPGPPTSRRKIPYFGRVVKVNPQDKGLC